MRPYSDSFTAFHKALIKILLRKVVQSFKLWPFNKQRLYHENTSSIGIIGKLIFKGVLYADQQIWNVQVWSRQSFFFSFHASTLNCCPHRWGKFSTYPCCHLLDSWSNGRHEEGSLNIQVYTGLHLTVSDYSKTTDEVCNLKVFEYSYTRLDWFIKGIILPTFWS